MAVPLASPEQEEETIGEEHGHVLSGGRIIAPPTSAVNLPCTPLSKGSDSVLL
jgi:hypothetical protein